MYTKNVTMALTLYSFHVGVGWIRGRAGVENKDVLLSYIFDQYVCPTGWWHSDIHIASYTVTTTECYCDKN